MNEILSALWRASFQGGIALLIVWLLCRLLPRLPANLHCWLWRLAFLRCLIGLFLALTVSLPILPQAKPIALPQATVTAAAPSLTPQPPLPFHGRGGEIRASGEEEGVRAAPSEEYPSSPPSGQTSWVFWLTLVYFIGVAVGVLRLIVGAARMRRMIQRATVMESAVLTELATKFGCRRTPRLVRSPEVSSPLLAFGTVLLPEVAMLETDETLVLAHELAHYRRRDLVWEWLGIAAQTVLWFHPLVWLARREERLTRELAADALTVTVIAATPADYARTLVAASLRRSGRLPGFAVGVVEGGSRLRVRLEALSRPRLARRHLIVPGAIACIVAGLGFLPWRAVARQAPASAPHIVEPPTATSAPSSEQRGVMSGVVLNSSGQPVPNAKISWIVPADPKSKIIATTTTDNRGAFVFDKAPGSAAGFPNFREFWRLRLDGWVMVQAKGYGLGVQRVRYEKRTVTIRLTTPQTYTAVFHDASGKPVVGLDVWAEALNNNHSFFKMKWLGYSGTTNTKGEFQTKGLPQNDSVWFRFDQSQWSVLNQRTAGARTIYTLGTGHTVEGTVRFPDGRPVQGANIQATAIQGSPWTDANSYTDSEGHYRMVGLGTGSYLLRLWVPNARKYVGPSPQEITLPGATAHLTRDITLVRAVRVTGRVTDTDGKPLSGLSVMAGSDYTVTDREGHYETAIPPGKATISVQNRDAKTIDAVLGPPMTVDITLARNTLANIHGQVLDSHGEPVTGEYVSVQGQHIVSGATTDSQGNFSWSMQLQDSGPLTVFVHKGNEGAVATFQPGDDKPLTLRLSETNIGHLIGQVTDPAGKPVPGLVIQVTERHMMNAGYQPAIDAQGHFSILTLPDIAYHLGFVAPGYGMRAIPAFYDAEKEDVVKVAQTRQRLLTAKPGETRDLGHIVLVHGNDTATGRLLDSRGKPLPDAQITLMSKSGTWFGKTDATGYFSIPSVVKGERCVLGVFVPAGTHSPGNGPLRTWLMRGRTVGAMETITLTDQEQPPR